MAEYLELALSHYASSIVKVHDKYMAYQIQCLCAYGIEVSGNTYAARASGYYNAEQTLEKIQASNTELANKIKSLLNYLQTDSDFEIV